jgi:putative NADPH-quinone reductase
MKILYVYAHPNPHSFNALLKNTALHFFQKENVTVKQSDLYAQVFSPTASWNDFGADQQNESHYFLAQQAAFLENKLSNDIAIEIQKIQWADHLIFQFPLWWFSAPAILKGWFDRVLAKGFAYDAGKIFENGLLAGKTASLTVTTQSPESAYQTQGVHKATIDTFLHHIHHTLHFAGIKTQSPFVVYAAFQLNANQQKEITSNYENYLEKMIQSKVR